MVEPHAQDWQAEKTLAECNRYMFENKICCDVSFLVGENRTRVSAHKYVLISRSSVFYAMFCGPLAETEGKEIEIPDVPEEIFTSLVRYMYGEESQVTPESVLRLLYTSRKYAVVGLEKKITSWLASNITTETVATILNQAILYGDQRLEYRCLRFIDTHKAIYTLCSLGFQGLTRDSLIKVLGRDSLKTEENNIFEGTMEWSKAECNRLGLPQDGKTQREVLGEVIHLIRFPLLGETYLEDTVVPVGILSSEEIAQISQAIMKGNSVLCCFSSTTRHRTHVVLKVARSSELPRACGEEFGFDAYQEIVDGCTFTCDKPILFQGVSVYGPVRNNVPCRVDVSLVKDSRALDDTSFTFRSKGSTEPYPVIFRKPIYLQAGSEFEILAAITIDSDEFSIYSFEEDKRNVEVKGYNFTFKEEEMQDEDIHQIAEILFSVC